MKREEHHSMETIISRTFRVVIPKKLRKRLDLKPGLKLRVFAKSGVLLLVPEVSLDTLRGLAAGEPVRGYRGRKDRIRWI
jgi:AbrB family looped-hinge helix DNA binding protein